MKPNTLRNASLVASLCGILSELTMLALLTYSVPDGVSWRIMTRHLPMFFGWHLAPYLAIATAAAFSRTPNLIRFTFLSAMSALALGVYTDVHIVVHIGWNNDIELFILPWQHSIACLTLVVVISAVVLRRLFSEPESK